tara:strand:+ start:2613 stop:2831 length:219 start_codon:yes stop_codon:yes gene_type:complete
MKNIKVTFGTVYAIFDLTQTSGFIASNKDGEQTIGSNSLADWQWDTDENEISLHAPDSITLDELKDTQPLLE